MGALVAAGVASAQVAVVSMGVAGVFDLVAAEVGVVVTPICSWVLWLLLGWLLHKLL
jgi:hypothetical protein